MRRAALLAAAATVPLAACGSASSTPTVTRTVVVTASSTSATSPASSTPATGASSAPTTAAAAPDATTAQVASATLPPMNSRARMTLHDGKGQAGSVQCDVDPKVPAVLADVDSDGGKEAVGTVTCNGGTSNWPAEIVVVDHDGSTLLDYPLYSPERGHSRITSLTPQAGAVTIGWTAYDLGRGPDLGMRGALRVEKGQGVYLPSGAPTNLAPAGAATTPTGTTRSGTVDRAQFASPTGNILCFMDSSGARCDVLGATFTTPPKPASCEYEWGPYVTMTAGSKAELNCPNDPAYAGGDQGTPPWFDGSVDGVKAASNGAMLTTLGYGHELRSASISCVVDKTTGVTCKDLNGAHGFTVSRQRYRVW